jgi:hypothetical protein
LTWDKKKDQTKGTQDMKAKKVFKAFALSAVLLAGMTGAALAQDQLVSGEPYPGFFEGVAIPANGPIVTDLVATEAPGNLVKVEGRTISQGHLSVGELAAINPEAFLGEVELEADGELTAIAMVR